MLIRPFQNQDARALTQLFHDSVHVIGARDYSDEQLSAWSPQPVTAETFIRRISDGRDIFVAINTEKEPVGFIELEKNGHIDCFYCRPDVAGTGIGKELYNHLERMASERGIEILFVEASEAAKRFFIRQGFKTDHRRNFKYNGVDIHNFLMRKSL
ncbi:MAG: GNAT family N-acetyltransferase [Rhodobacteraceae bacterium]|nr:MAG: GNAT family N-acetyltransferase [Paracoccaceae bacterium]